MTAGFRLTDVGGVPVMSPTGDLDLATLPAWHTGLQRAIDRHAGQTLVVDLDGVGSLDDLAVGVLLSAAARANDRGGRLELVASSDHLRTKLTRLGLDRVVTVRPRIAP